MSLSAASQHADRVEERDGATAEETAHGNSECNNNIYDYSTCTLVCNGGTLRVYKIHTHTWVS